MGKRIFKQIIIAFIFILILGGVGFLFYYLTRPAPSCSDNIQNQGEEEADCGGPCQSCALVHLEEIKVISADFISNQDNFYDLAAQIKNPNQNYGGGKIDYHFELYDSQNKLISQSRGTTFILPNQTKYLIQLKIASPKTVSKVNFILDQVEWQKLENYQSPQLFISQKEYYPLTGSQPGFSQVRGVLINKSNFDFDKVEIDVLLFDSSRHLVGLNTTEARTLLSGQKRDFVATWFKEIKGNVVFVEAEAETDLFDESNFLKKSGGAEEFQAY